MLPSTPRTIEFPIWRPIELLAERATLLVIDSTSVSGPRAAARSAFAWRSASFAASSAALIWARAVL